ncbi:PfaD family polyunsaturated fatty acid/polyketide biosynthesis protein [Amycolatopsis minnesotensis]|uniref:PfaD family polyunsaturated fatty acid/polyketide biosynthesis protein n=1 Tax=Amycolatopsis minnesotensis TaxID=337894 RepID=A0ABN2QR17_9PSEU
MKLAHAVSRRVHVVARDDGLLGLADDRGAEGARTVGTVPPSYPEWLGDRGFLAAHDVRFPYVAGEMAQGIATPDLVVAMARAEMLAFYGAAGLGMDDLGRGVDTLADRLSGRRNWGVNLLHMPEDPAGEDQVADVLLRKRVPRISASAFLDVTPALARCAAKGLRQDRSGEVTRPVSVFAKVSRPELAKMFFSPAPAGVLRYLVERGQLTEDEARLARHVPLAEDVTVEADSGGHTDGRPLVALLPTVLALRDTAPLGGRVRVGAAGGLGDPAGVAAAFALGADYVLTGTVNQMSVEAGISARAKDMLARATVADTAMAPSAAMFELGAQVQVLRRGTLFAARAGRLRALYDTYPSVEAIPAAELARVERELWGAPVEQVWEQTRAYWSDRNPAALDRAESDPKHRMALIFRWYLGLSNRWAISGSDRTVDYQLWCGPAAGAFNAWVAGSFLSDGRQRTVAQIALNLLQGAAVLTRAHQLRTLGVRLPQQAFVFRPRRLR